MPSASHSILYVSDLSYPARGRRYCDEDIFLTSRLRERFVIAVCHPLDVVALMDTFDVVVVRNSGPVVHYRAQYDEFRDRATECGVRVYNELTGKADMAGKQYLLDLSGAGFPVIPTIDRPQDLGHLPEVGDYVVKPKRGADSAGLEFVSWDRLWEVTYDGVLVQPRIDFQYEVSFYFVDSVFRYALFARRPDQRWKLEPYEPTAADLDFAQRFIDWNDMAHGIQRVDACRTQDGELLLVELEDLNPYLSLDRLPAETRDVVIAEITVALHRLLGCSPRA